MLNSEINTDVLKNSNVSSVVLIHSTSRVLISFFRSQSDKKEFVFFRELDINNPIEILNFLDQFKPDSLQLISASPDFTLLPTVVLSEDSDDRQWLEHLPGKVSRELVFSENDPLQAFRLIFSEGAGNYNFFTQIRSDIRIRHLVNVLHENCANNRLASIWSKVVCFFLEKRFFVIAYKNNELKLANSFYYDVPADILYYLLWVKNEIFGNDAEVPFYLNGLITKDSKIFQLLKSYIKDLNFGTGGPEIRSADDSLPPVHTLGILLEKV